jgi:hypothetical protein
LQNPSLSDWRLHAGGMQRLIDMRGGIKKLANDAPYMISSLVIYILYALLHHCIPMPNTRSWNTSLRRISIVHLGNSYSPSWDQMRISELTSFKQTVEDVANLYSLIFPYTLCPPELYFDMLRTTELRAMAVAARCVDPGLEVEAYEILARIKAFSPEDWAQPGELTFTPSCRLWVFVSHPTNSSASRLLLLY